jgi:hypothetical protein
LSGVAPAAPLRRSLLFIENLMSRNISTSFPLYVMDTPDTPMLINTSALTGAQSSLQPAQPRCCPHDASKSHVCATAVIQYCASRHRCWLPRSSAGIGRGLLPADCWLPCANQRTSSIFSASRRPASIYQARRPASISQYDVSRVIWFRHYSF